MRLTQWTDYTLRVLMYCAANEGREQPITITEVAESFDISRSHLTKIVQQLAADNLLETSRGRGGGMRLAQDAGEINVGTVVRQFENLDTFVECMDPATSTCPVRGACGLQGVLGGALGAFVRYLDDYTLADLLPQPARFRALLGTA